MASGTEPTERGIGWPWFLLAFLLPPVGFICGIYWMAKSRVGPGLALWGTALVGGMASCALVLGSATEDVEKELRGVADEAQTELDRLTEAVVVEGKPGRAVVVESDDGDIRLSVRLADLLDPLLGGEYEAPEAGRRYVGVVFRVTNRGPKAFDGSATTNLVYEGGRDASAAILTGGSCPVTAGASTIAPGASSEVCAPFELSTDARLTRVQYTVSMDSPGSVTAEWRAPLRPDICRLPSARVIPCE